MAKPHLRIGTRGSDLALRQTNQIRDILKRERDCETEIVIIKTEGDRHDRAAFSELEGRGFFTRDIEQALLEHKIDLAVHSLKDLMTVQPDGLTLAAVGFRADRRELLVMRREARGGDSLIPVKDGCTIGTGSARRRCQIAHFAPALTVRDLRGNVPTRVEKVRNGEYDAIIIAAAGVQRLGLDLSDLDAVHLDPEHFLPAPGQGILALQTRSDDAQTFEIVYPLNDPQAEIEAALERGLLARFNSGCSLPLGVLSDVKEGPFRLLAALGDTSNPDSGVLKRADVSGTGAAQVISQAFEQLTSKS